MKKFLKYGVITSLVLLVAVTAFFLIFANSIFGINSDTSFNKDILIQMNAKISLYDNEDNFVETVSSFHPIARLSELPDYVKDSFIAIEDKQFYNHNGLNYKRMAKALYSNIISGSAKEGASTISQQLIKNTHLTSEKTIDRKIKEILLTLKLEKEFTKDDILETYLNVIYFGNRSYGIESAANNYFNKKAKDLSLAESATLAGIIKSPVNYSPIYDLEASNSRRKLILNEMFNDGKITANQLENAKAEKLKLDLSNEEKNKSIYEKGAIKEASKLLDLSEKDVAISGIKIFTYMDNDLQNEVEKTVLDMGYYHINENEKIADSGVCVIDNKSGGIKAFYGKTNYDLTQVIRAPGSAIKPILVYAPALEYGKISPTTPLLDDKININGYSPHNVGNKYYGWVTARNSIEKSLNIPAIKLLQYVGIEKAKKFSEKAGIVFNEKDNGYAIALGGFTDGTTLTQLTASYLPFANAGKYITPKFIKRIENINGDVLYERIIKEEQIMSEETAYLMTDMLVSSAKYGTSQKLSTLDFSVAGKTGTVGIKGTNENSDAWSMAYTPSTTVGVWMGNATGSKEGRLAGSNNGGTYATMLARDVLKIENDEKKDTFTVPNNIITKKIDLIELKDNHTIALSNKNTPDMYTVKEVFNKKYLPKKMSSNFEDLKTPILRVSASNNVAKISFKAKTHLAYEIYRIEEDETKLIKSIKDKNGLIVFKDDTLENNVIYSYYIVATQTNNITGDMLKSEESRPIKVITEKKGFLNLISNIKEKAKKNKKRFIFWN